MNDFFDSLKEIKKDMVKDEDKKKIKSVKKNPNRDEFKDIFKDEEFNIEKESITHREKRLKNEFEAYIKHADIKKI